MKRKHAIVTGGTRGLGKEITLGLAASGYQVHAIYFRDEESANRLTQDHLNITAHKVDLSSPDEISVFCTKMNGVPLALLVNNASPAFSPKNYHKWTGDEVDNMWVVNVRAPYLLCTGLLKNLKSAQSAQIINLLTHATLGEVDRGGGAYAVAKFGLLGLNKVLALELAPFKVRVNAISPGALDIGMSQSWPESLKEALLAQGTTSHQQVLRVISYLCSDESQGLTGANIDPESLHFGSTNHN